MSDHPPTFTAPAISQLAPLFPGYEIESLIATGGMGAVYCAVQKSLDRTVAIKILPHEFSNDQAFCQSFEAEAKAMARLNHPNLIGVYDFGEVNGMLFIIMEYVPGQSVFHSSNGIAIDPMEVIRLLSGICNGLAHAHENGILHRDIKPSNILLDLNAEPKIGDFGLARPVDRKVLEGEEIFGTPHYTAPEVVNAPQTVNQRADIFSVGVMLHELLTGKLPADDPRPASAIIHCDPRFDTIIRKATNPTPELRYSSAAEITRDLQTIASSAGPRVLRTTTPAAAHHTPKRHRPVVVSQSGSSGGPAVFIIVALVVTAIIAYLMFSGSADNNPRPGPHQTSEDTISIPPPVPDPSPTNPQPAIVDHSPDEDDTSHAPEPVSMDDDMAADEEIAEHTAGDPDPAEKVAPKFDVPGFLLRASAIMKERATPLIANRDKSLAENLKAFERDGNRAIRRIDSRTLRASAEELFGDLLTEAAREGNVIPGTLGQGLSLSRDIRDLHKSALDNQQAAQDLLRDSLKQLSATYILGLEKQIERLETEDDPAAIELISDEIAKTKTRDSHFHNLMLGIASNEDQDEED